jgi:hypothetical protein
MGISDVNKGVNFGLGGVYFVEDNGVMKRDTLAWYGMPNQV